MNTFKTLAMIVAGGFVSATSAVAGGSVLPGDGSFTQYGVVDGWTVYVDVERESCLIERVDASANVVQMGLTADHKLGYLGVFSKTAELGSGNKEKIFIDLDGTMYNAKATKMKKNITEGYSGGYILADNPQFIEDLAQKYTMTVFPEKEASFQVDLAGTHKAMELARNCNAEQG
ncbi:hypothetical protein [Parasedimentitalea huanghaiensis]|uniref:Uncharacterized protein n=1 Tax=Parasedimentitalea huanghaiensis TaxID=2682100 RepID=A0A6L6WCU7_9RHOB|nr:hypothetical protein [Zongyanglinia huanghaiensis]MVO14709.1 hypothetical protein [Zongyanglinia huanghaiensis]